MAEESIRVSFREYGVQETIIDVLIMVCPKESLNRCVSILSSVTNQVSGLEQLVKELGGIPGVGQTSHPMRQIRHFIYLGDRLRDFTRDYIRRCCDLIEYMTKFRLAAICRKNVEKQPLGTAIQSLKGLPEDLVRKLALFNTKIYNLAKHQMPRENRHMYSVADSIAVTFVCLDLARAISDYVSSASQMAP